jgi:hypothetical protein
MEVPPPPQPVRPETKDIYNFGDTVRLINLETTKFADMNHKIGTVYPGVKEMANPTTEGVGMWSKEENGRHKVRVMVEKGGVYDAETATYSQPIFKTVKVLPKCMELVNGGLVTNVVRGFDQFNQFNGSTHPSKHHVVQVRNVPRWSNRLGVF